MTVIACRAGVLATDSSGWIGELAVARMKKITRLEDGSLFAASGERQIIVGVKRWLAGKMFGDKPPMPDDDAETGFGAIWLRRDGIWLIHNRAEPYLLDADFAAEGAHAEFCYGAMADGASAEEAVELAIKYGAFARGPVQVERL